MPKLNGWYERKRPHLQIKILKLIALTGKSSQKEAVSQLRCKPSTISEAFKVLKTTKLIEGSTNELDKGVRGEKFYKLSSVGLEAFIEHSLEGFWTALTWYCILNPHVNQAEFNRYYNLFIGKFVGSFPLRSCFFMGNLFENLSHKLRRRLDDSDSGSRMLDYSYYEVRLAYTVLECLLLNRGVTIKKIIELTQLTEQEIRKVLKSYSINQQTYYQYSNHYEDVYQSSRSIDTTIDLLNHLIIVPTEWKKEGEEMYYDQDQKFELSLLGILLTLSIISLKRQQQKGSYYIHYYNKAATNYQEKLPLIFGKWKLLKNVLDFYVYPSIFDYLLSSYKSEILSASISVGGNKEIYDNIRSATISTINKFFVVYDQGISALQTGDYPERFLNSEQYRFVREKLNEIEISLKYADLESFAKYMKNKKVDSDFDPGLISHTFKNVPKLFAGNKEKENIDLQNDLHYIENALADEFSFLFYIGLLRENNHKASDYPLTTGFLRPSPSLGYPKMFLMKIVNSDNEIRDRLAGWIKEASIYQKQSLVKIDEICVSIKNA